MQQRKIRCVPPMQGSLSYALLADDCIAIKDLDFAAYCKLRGLVGGDAICTDGRGGSPKRFLFHFYDPTGRIKQLGIDYLNSEAAQHADLVRRLKRICRIVSDSELTSSEFEWKSCIMEKGH